MVKSEIARLKVGVDIDVNKSQFNEIQKEFDSLAIKAKFPGQNLSEEMISASNTARTVSNILEDCFNKKLNTLDIAKFSQELQKSGLNAHTLKTNLEKSGEDGGRAFNRLTSEILGTNIQLKQSNAWLDKMAITMSNTIRFGISSAVFNKMTNSISEAYGYVKKLDNSLNNIRVVSGASADQMKDFAVQANKAAKALGATTLDYTNASLIYYQQGLSGEDVLARTEATLKLANTTGEAASDVSDYMTAIWNNFDNGSKSIEYYADVLAKLGAETASSSDEIAAGLEKFASVAETVGLSYEYATSALTTITSATRQSADTVGTALKTLFSRIQDLELGSTLDDGTTLGSYSEALSKVGINIKDQNGELKDMDDILDEMGSKWETLSSDQQVALAQSVAGVRQYNQLMALMNNWDDMKDNIERTADAEGTLNEQNEIYLESTEAHLNKLETSWEKFYSSIFDTKEINPLIDAFTDIVTAIGVMSDSFGGGAKSLLGFGAMFVNVFQKQIDKSLTHFISNTNIAKQNLAALQIRNQFAQEGSSKIGTSIEATAEQKATESQIENAKRLAAVFDSLETTQAQQVIDLQNQAIELEKQALTMDLNAEGQTDKLLSESQNLFSEDENQSIFNVRQNIEELNALMGEIREKHIINQEELEREEESLSNLLNIYDSQKAKKQDILDIQEEIEEILIRSQETEKTENLAVLSDGLKTNNLTAKKKTEILKLAKEIVAEEKKNTAQVEKTSDAIEEEYKTKKKSENLRDKESGINKQIDANLLPIEKASPWVGVVNGLTTSVTALSTAWSGLNSIISIWADTDLTTGEKLLQTLTTVTMVIPGVISAVTSLKAMQDKWTASRAASLAATEAEIAAESENIAAKEAAVVITGTSAVTKESEATATAIDATAQEAEAVATETNVAATEADIIATEADTVAKEGEATATSGAAVAQGILNTVMMMNPIVLIITALVALVAGIAAYTAAAKKAAEAQVAANDESYEAANAAQEEAAAQEKACDAFLDTYKAYQDGTSAKSDLIKVSDDLVEILGAEAIEVAKLTGNYDDLVDKIKNVKKETISKQINELNTKMAASADNMQTKAIQSSAGTKDGSDRIKVAGSGNHGMGYGDELDDREFSQYLSDLGYTEYLDDYEETENGYSWNLGISTKSDAESMSKLRDLWDQYVKETQDEDSDYYVTSSEKSESEMYQAYKEFFESYADDLENYNNSKTEKGEKEAQQEVLNTDFSKTEDYSTYKTQRENMADTLRSVDEDTYGNMSDEELYGLIDKQALSENENLGDVIQKGALQDSVLKKQLEDYYDQSGAESALNNLNKDELAALAGSGKDLTELLGGMSDSSLTLEEKLKALAEQFGAADTSVINLNDALKEELETLGVSDEEFEEQVKQLKKLNPELKDNEDKAKSIALANIKMNKGLEDLSDNFDEYSEVLKDGKKGSAEYAKALNSMQNIMGNILNIDGEVLSDSFYTSAENMDLMQKAAEGDTDAIEALRQAAGNDIIANIQTNSDEARQALQDFDNVIDNINTKDLEVGATVDLEDGYEALNEFIKTSGMTADQVNNYLNSMGYQAEIETTEGTQTVHYSGVYPKLNDDGTITTIPWATDVEEKVEVPTIKSLNYQGPAAETVNFSNTKAGKSSSSGSGSTKSKNTSDEKSDRYQQVNNQLAETNAELKKIQSQTEKLTGADLVKNLNSQIENLNKNLDLTEQKLKIAEQEQQEYASQLASTYGIQFNADGSINQSSYESIFKQEQARYTSANSDDEAAKTRWEDFKNAISEYNSLDTTIQGLIQDKIDTANAVIEKQIAAFRVSFDISLDLTEARQQWIEFKKDVIDELADEDLLGTLKSYGESLETYFRDDSTGAIQQDKKRLESLMTIYDKFKAGDKNTIYGDDEQSLLDDIEEAQSQLQEDLTDWESLLDEIQGMYLKGLEQAADAFSDAVEDMSAITQIVDHQIKLMEYALGNKAYKEQNKAYNDKVKAIQSQIDLQTKENTFWKNQLTSAEERLSKIKDTNSEEYYSVLAEYEKAKEEYENSTNELLSSYEDQMDALTSAYVANIESVFQMLNQGLTGVASLDAAQEEWDLLNKESEEYLDTINAIYGVQSLANKYTESINEQSTTAQQKLSKIMESELETLRAKDKLSQYDLDRADLRYQIALKQIALEESQQNKSTLRLRRDSQGNYTYQYTQDEDEITKLQNELSDLYNQLYNLDTDKYSGNLEKVYELTAEYQDKYKEILQDASLADEERQQKVLELTETYGDLINSLTEQNEDIKANLRESAMAELFDLYGKDEDNYNLLTEAQKSILDQFLNEEVDLTNSAYNTIFGIYDENVEKTKNMTTEQINNLMTSLVPEWTSAYQNIVDNLNAEGGFKETMLAIQDDLEAAAQDYFETIRKGYAEADSVAEDHQTLIEGIVDDYDDLIDTYEQLMEDIANNQEKLDSFVNTWKKAADESEKLLKNTNDTIEAMKTLKLVEAAEEEEKTQNNVETKTETKTDTNSNSNTNSGTANNSSKAEGVAAAIWINGSDSSGWGKGQTRYKRLSEKGVSAAQDYLNSASNGNLYNKWKGKNLKPYYYGAFDTGGYTGEWGSEGKLAMLHQKELVLNAEDTKNILASVAMLRNMTSSNLSQIGANVGISGNGFEQNVHIDATFPNVTNSNEIEEAFNNLVNIAAQRANR